MADQISEFRFPARGIDPSDDVAGLPPLAGAAAAGLAYRRRQPRGRSS
jgi:hypothetical protein